MYRAYELGELTVAGRSGYWATCSVPVAKSQEGNTAADPADLFELSNSKRTGAAANVAGSSKSLDIAEVGQNIMAVGSVDWWRRSVVAADLQDSSAGYSIAAVDCSAAEVQSSSAAAGSGKDSSDRLAGCSIDLVVAGVHDSLEAFVLVVGSDWVSAGCFDGIAETFSPSTDFAVA